MTISKQQKQIAMVAGGLILAYLVYRWYSGAKANQTQTATGTPATSGTDYATLAGQEQGDIAALQQQEQGDYATLLGDIQQYLTGQQGLEKAILKIAMGQQKIERAQHIKITKGSALARYWQKVTGHKPPAQTQATNFIYEAFKAGISAARLRELLGRKGEPHHGHKKHPNDGHKHIKHPNPNHQPRTGHHVGRGGPIITNHKGTQRSGAHR